MCIYLNLMILIKIIRGFISALRAKEPELAKAWIFANLLAAFLIDDIIQPSLDFPPRSAGSEKKN
ncbi:transposase for insertion sequence element IS421 domain protein [Escherichia coli EPECa12]|nr:transposase for insertion sequence element IS421 domain protein [Escherichia coli EPECa12]